MSLILHWNAGDFEESVAVQYKNAFQWDAYRPLVDCIPACTVAGGGVPARGVPTQGVHLPGGGGVYLLGGVPAWGVYLPGGYLPRYPLPSVDRQTLVKT